MNTLGEIKGLAHRAGHLRALILRIEGLWREDREKCELIVAESVQSWNEYELIPVALRVLITENNDHDFRQTVRRICDLKHVNRFNKVSLYFVAALRGDLWAKDYVSETYQLALRKVMKSDVPLLSDVAKVCWGWTRMAILNEHVDLRDLEEMSGFLECRRVFAPDLFGRIQAQVMLAEAGYDGLEKWLEGVFDRKTMDYVETHVSFLLGCSRNRKYAPIFQRICNEKLGTKMMCDSLWRTCLSSLAYCTALDDQLSLVIEKRLVGERTKFASWWFGSARQAIFAAICCNLRNSNFPMGPSTVEVLRRIAEGAHSRNANYAIALLSLKGEELPVKIASVSNSFNVKFLIDALQYDVALDLSYYGRIT